MEPNAGPMNFAIREHYIAWYKRRCPLHPRPKRNVYHNVRESTSTKGHTNDNEENKHQKYSIKHTNSSSRQDINYFISYPTYQAHKWRWKRGSSNIEPPSHSLFLRYVDFVTINYTELNDVTIMASTWRWYPIAFIHDHIPGRSCRKWMVLDTLWRTQISFPYSRKHVYANCLMLSTSGHQYWVDGVAKFFIANASAAIHYNNNLLSNICK